MMNPTPSLSSTKLSLRLKTMQQKQHSLLCQNSKKVEMPIIHLLSQLARRLIIYRKDSTHQNNNHKETSDQSRTGTAGGI